MSKDQLAAVFGAELKKIRLKIGLSQEDLALASNVDRTYISKLERGIRQPSLRMIFTLCKTLNYEPDKIVKSVWKQVNQKSN